MFLIDTHAHIYDSQYDEDRELVIERLLNNSIKKIFLPNIDINTIEPMIDLCSKYPNIFYPMIGLHPCDVLDDFENILSHMEQILYNDISISSNNPTSKRYKFYAIGEVGIDLYHEKKYLKHQIIALKRQIQWSKDFELPLVVHVRNAHKETISTIQENVNFDNSGIIHCFNGTLDQAKEIIDLNFLLGIGGVLTFKNSGLRDVIKHIDLKHMVLETDSPYLAPVPFRGSRNEPSYISVIADELSQIKNVDIETVTNITSKNALKIFKINDDSTYEQEL